MRDPALVRSESPCRLSFGRGCLRVESLPHLGPCASRHLQHGAIVEGSGVCLLPHDEVFRSIPQGRHVTQDHRVEVERYPTPTLEYLLGVRVKHLQPAIAAWVVFTVRTLDVTPF